MDGWTLLSLVQSTDEGLRCDLLGIRMDCGIDLGRSRLKGGGNVTIGQLDT